MDKGPHTLEELKAHELEALAKVMSVAKRSGATLADVRGAAAAWARWSSEITKKERAVAPVKRKKKKEKK